LKEEEEEKACTPLECDEENEDFSSREKRKTKTNPKKSLPSKKKNI
jgi:hypothetical protein